MAFLDNVLERALLQCQAVKGQKVETQLAEIERLMAGLFLPRNYDSTDPTNTVIQFEKDLQDLYNTMERHGVQQPHKLTLFEFFSKVAALEKLSKHGRKQD